MRLRPAAFVLLAACAGMPTSHYVPQGEGLPSSARRSYRRALSAARHGDLARARRILDGLCTHHPLRLAFHLERLRVVKQAESAEAAAHLYEPPPPGVDPERARILASLARLGDDRLQERRELLQFAASYEAREALWLVGLSDVDLRIADRVAARGRLERDLGQVDRAAASLAEAQSIFERVHKHLQAVLELDSELAEAYLALGILATRRADLATSFDAADDWRRRAEEHYRKALSLDPRSLPGRINLAENLLYFEMYDDAIQQLRWAADLAPPQILVWRNLGLAYYKAGRLGDAEKSYRTALSLQPHNAAIRVALADCLRRQQDADEATAELFRAREDVGDDDALRAVIAFKLGALYEHTKQYKQAVEQYERHIELGGEYTAKARSRVRTIYDHAFEE